MAESKSVQLNFENSSYNVCIIIIFYAFSMLSLGHILISDLVIANLFMHSLSDMILLYLATSFHTKGIYTQGYSQTLSDARAYIYFISHHTYS